MEAKSCNVAACPELAINGGWSQWGAWSTCSLTCGSGVTTRFRRCDSPAPSSTGRDCAGDPMEADSCNMTLCQEPTVNGDWSQWGAWSTCSLTCGSGVTTRFRRCDSPAPSSSGTECTGDPMEADSCEVTRCQGSTGTCDLEHGMCGWTQAMSDIFDWTLFSGPTVSQETGPLGDHTHNTSAGRYLYIEASSPRTLGHDAVLRSSLISGQHDACFSMYYNMFGTGTGNLTVMIQNNCNKHITELFSMSGNKGQAWLFRQVNISASTVPNDYNILIRGTVGNSYQSDIAIDDLRIDNFACGAFQNLEVDCTFDHDLCRWSQSTDDQFNWTRHAGASPTTGTGPSGDYTTGNGYYLYTEASNMPAGQKADLLSPILPPGRQFCFHIATSMYGSDMGYMRIMTKPEGSTTKHTVTTIGRRTTATWETHNVNIPTQSGPYRIVIEGVIGTSYRSDVAFDDVSLTQCMC